MVYICPIKISFSISSLTHLTKDIFHIQEIKDQELLKVLKTVDIESGEFPIILTSHDCDETEVVEKYQTTVYIHDLEKHGFPEFKENDQIIILDNICHTLITLV
jgi:hypothetical protein